MSAVKKVKCVDIDFFFFFLKSSCYYEFCFFSLSHKYRKRARNKLNKKLQVCFDVIPIVVTYFTIYCGTDVQTPKQISPWGQINLDLDLFCPDLLMSTQESSCRAQPQSPTRQRSPQNYDARDGDVYTERASDSLVHTPLLEASRQVRSLDWRQGRLETDWQRIRPYCGTVGGGPDTRGYELFTLDEVCRWRLCECEYGVLFHL